MGFDPARLDHMLVGVQDGTGRCLGLGVLEEMDGTISVATRHGDDMEGLRLGSMRVDPETFAVSPGAPAPAHLRNLRRRERSVTPAG